MSGVQIRAWNCGNRPVDDRGHYVQIVGRTNGFMGHLLGFAGVDNSIRLAVNLERLEFSSWGCGGPRTRIVPLENVSETWSGVEKPWFSSLFLMALAWGFVGMTDWHDLLNPLGLAQWSLLTAAGVMLVSALLCFWFYRSSRLVVLGIQTRTGSSMQIRFEKTTVQGVTLGEDEARRICKVVQRLIEAKHRLRVR